MKHLKFIFAFIFFALILTITGCPVETYEVTIYEPVYLSYEELRSSVNISTTKELKNIGKIAIKDNYLFVNQINKGIHIIDNKDPKNPVNKSFINIPGNIDLVIKDNILYADSFIDLVAIDISDLTNDKINVTKRINNTFIYDPYQIILKTNSWYVYFENIDMTKGVVIDWKERKETRTRPIGVFFGVYVTTKDSGTSVNGSMSRFAIYSNYLYTVSNNDMKVFDITTTNNPAFWAKINMNWGIETIFPYNDKLFIGSRTGMYIYDNNNPANPVQLSQLLHVRSFDPVVVENNYAYVTLRGFINQLDVIDISDMAKPVLKNSYAMAAPYGLGIENSILFICDNGLKIYDAKDPLNLKLIKFIPEISSYDVIPYQSKLT
ncbi:MAG: hypothetical protein A2Z98_01230, partial [Spirochaetes bacterium GWB1_27_13]